MQMFPVFSNGARVNKNIININNGEITEGVKNVIHDVLKLTWGILKTKWLSIPLIMSKMSGKSCFVSIMLTNLNFLEPRFHVKPGKHCSFTQPMNKVIFIRNRIPNPFQDLI